MRKSDSLYQQVVMKSVPASHGVCTSKSSWSLYQQVVMESVPVSHTISTPPFLHQLFKASLIYIYTHITGAFLESMSITMDCAEQNCAALLEHTSCDDVECLLGVQAVDIKRASEILPDFPRLRLRICPGGVMKHGT